MLVDLIHTHTSDGLRLDGFLRGPTTTASSRFGIDVAICFHGVTGNFYQAGVFDEATDRLVEGGCAVLRVNNRGHDPISMPAYNSAGRSPLGAAYETVDDCRYDWDAWVGFAEDQGFHSIGLWGHSLGAVKSLYYMAKEQDCGSDASSLHRLPDSLTSCIPVPRKKGLRSFRCVNWPSSMSMQANPKPCCKHPTRSRCWLQRECSSTSTALKPGTTSWNTSQSSQHLLCCSSAPTRRPRSPSQTRPPGHAPP